VEGSTVFSEKELEAVTRPFTTTALGRPVSFAELLQARSAVTDLYVKRGYVTSGAILRPQEVKDGVVVLDVVEGSLSKINVTGTRRLNPGYVGSRLSIAAGRPLNINKLLEGLQLLQLNPLIQTISADLQAGIEPGTNVLAVTVNEAKTFIPQLSLDNGRVAAIGTIERQIQINELNLTGLGDAISLAYTNTNGSNALDFSYTLPVSPYNSTVAIAFGGVNSNVIEEPFDVLDISSQSRYFEVTLRHPLIQTPAQELALGLAFSNQRSQSFLGIDNIGPFPLSPGADSQGRTRVSALRFFQEWSHRSSAQVLSLRSQFSFGLEVLDATINPTPPDSRFFDWLGQAQWVRLLAPDMVFLARSAVQLANRPILPVEQFQLGGLDTVRGYPQDYISTDNAVFGSAEFRIPIVRLPSLNGVLQLTPFFDIGYGWNSSDREPINTNTLLSPGIGLRLQLGDRFNARLDWGIPLIPVDRSQQNWQDLGLYFSIVYAPF
jgi:hemolysin activation/secretion protein